MPTWFLITYLIGFVITTILLRYFIFAINHKYEIYTKDVCRDDWILSIGSCVMWPFVLALLLAFFLVEMLCKIDTKLLSINDKE